jgi:DNA-directed RNA polymerase specialized sigma24 family protein
MTEREISTALDVPVGSIGPWISRALTSMNKELS